MWLPTTLVQTVIGCGALFEHQPWPGVSNCRPSPDLPCHTSSTRSTAPVFSIFAATRTLSGDRKMLTRQEANGPSVKSWTATFR
jgi:hypothetical protein